MARKVKPSLPPADVQVLTRREAAALARVNIQNIDLAIRREELPAYRPVGRKVLILREALMKWITSAPVWPGVKSGR
jgi:excisionase family DNA binding protein